MSTPRRVTSRTAAKRRAAARRRTREIGKYIFVYGVIAILVLGTVSIAILQQVPANSGSTAIATPTTASALTQLVTQADQAAATGDYASAVSFYKAYLQQSP